MSTLSLSVLHPGQRGVIAKVEPYSTQSGDSGLFERLLELGFLEGVEITVLHESPWGKDPIAVSVRGAIIALRRQEAECVQVTIAEPAAYAGVAQPKGEARDLTGDLK